MDPRGARRLPRERTHERRTPAQLAVGHVHARRRARATTSRRSISSSNIVRRWPQGNLYYLYGSYFTQWIAQTRTARKRSARCRPTTASSSSRGASTARSAAPPGKTYVEMYPEWVASMKERYEAQATAVRAKGLREGTRLTHHGQSRALPAMDPEERVARVRGRAPLLPRRPAHPARALGAAREARRERAPSSAAKESEGDAEHIARMNGESVASFTPDGGVVFGSQEFYKNVFLFGDLERLEPGKRSSFGLPDGGRIRITHGLRAADPAVSPDGRRVVFNINRAGTRSLHIADLREDGPRERTRSSCPPTSWSRRSLRAGRPTARTSPTACGSAAAIATSATSTFATGRGVISRTIAPSTARRASPPTVASLFFHSDRTGIMNVYAWEIATDRVRQVTNVLTGAYMPELSPDGKTLAYVGYTTAGFDLFAMAARRDAPGPTRPTTSTTGRPAPEVHEKRWDVKPYSPWRTLIPRRYGVQITEGSFGRAVIMTAAQPDLIGFHTATRDVGRRSSRSPSSRARSPTRTRRLPFDLGVSVFRSITPRGGYALGSYRPTVVQETTGFATSIVYTQPRAADSRSYVIVHSIARTGAELPTPIDKLDPYETPAYPDARARRARCTSATRTRTPSATCGASAPSAATRSASRSTSPTRASAATSPGFVTNGDLTMYYLMPWLKHHSLAAPRGRRARAAASSPVAARSTSAASSICRSSTPCATSSSRAASRSVGIRRSSSRAAATRSATSSTASRS